MSHASTTTTASLSKGAPVGTEASTSMSHPSKDSPCRVDDCMCEVDKSITDLNSTIVNMVLENARVVKENARLKELILDLRKENNALMSQSLELDNLENMVQHLQRRLSMQSMSPVMIKKVRKSESETIVEMHDVATQVLRDNEHPGGFEYIDIKEVQAQQTKWHDTATQTDVIVPDKPRRIKPDEMIYRAAEEARHISIEKHSYVSINSRARFDSTETLSTIEETSVRDVDGSERGDTIDLLDVEGCTTPRSEASAGCTSNSEVCVVEHSESMGACTLQNVREFEETTSTVVVDECFSVRDSEVDHVSTQNEECARCSGEIYGDLHESVYTLGNVFHAQCFACQVRNVVLR